MDYWPHQRYTIDKFKHTKMGLDFSDPGTGKTSAHLGRYSERVGRGRCLVVCPKTLMDTAWGNDLDKYFPTLSYAMATAGKDRFGAFESKTDIVIINTDGVKAITDKFKKRPQLQAFLREFDDLIIDEGASFKHAGSARSKSMLHVAMEIENRFLLGATPNPKSVTEIWHPAMIVDGGKRLGPAFYRFRNAMQVPTQVGPQPNHLRWDDRPEANEVTMRLLQDILVRHAFEEVMTDVPPNHVDYKRIALPKALMKMYRDLEKTCSLALSDGAVNAVHAAALRNKMLQVCSGAVYSSPEEYHVLDPFRYTLIADLVEEREHSVVFFNWKHQRDLLTEHFNKRKITFALLDGSTPQNKRADIVSRYQNGEYQTLLLHPKTGAHGLTLTRGTTSIVSSPIYEADYFKQMIHRIYRGGQTQITNTLLVCATGTVEELVYERLNSNKARMDDFLQLVQEAKHL